MTRSLPTKQTSMVAPDDKPDDPKTPGGGQGGSSDPPLIYRSEELLQGRREIWIEHGQEMYRLRITSAGKLYLTK